MCEDTTISKLPDPERRGEMAGEQIDRYTLLTLLGEGGFGVVYEAEQREPIRRRVAVKIIKAGMDSEAVVARFGAERQALAYMDHPCIARVLDGGVTAPELGSRPYFVMELVRGESITEHCDKHQLAVRSRLELFIKVCEAVQHAHTKGVVHRDLKPGNILITYDPEGRPTPKVIDFGVAKALSRRLTDETFFTGLGQIIGTPEYMSPEQAEMSGQDVDTRSDVYSLGVLLYELLTGSLPFDTSTLRGAGVPAMQRIIRENEPPKPSTKVSTMLAGGGSEAMVRRGADAHALMGALRRDLDWVVMRCLEKDRDRRYATVNDVAMELRRFLDGEPVLAGPPSVRYRLGKHVVRYRGRFIAAGVLLTVLLGGLAATTAATLNANTMRARAERESLQRGRVQDYLVGLFERLSPDGLGADARAVEMLEDGLRRLDDYPDDPELTGVVATVIAESFNAFGEHGRSLAIAEGALEDLRRAGVREDADPLHDAAWRRGDALFGLGRYAEAQRAFADLRPMLAARYGDDGLPTLTLDRDLAITARAMGMDDEAEHEYGEILARLRRQRDAQAERLRVLVRSDLISVLNDLGREREAYLVAREAIAEPGFSNQEVTQLIRLLHNGAQAARASGYTQDAADWHVRAVDTAELKLGVGHPRTARTAAYAGQSLAASGRSDEARVLLSRIIAGQESEHGELHPELVRLLIERAAVLGASAEGCEDLERASELIALHTGSSGVTETVRARLREVAGIIGTGCD